MVERRRLGIRRYIPLVLRMKSLAPTEYRFILCPSLNPCTRDCHRYHLRSEKGGVRRINNYLPCPRPAHRGRPDSGPKSRRPHCPITASALRA